MGIQGKARLVQLSTVCMAVDDLAKAVGRSFRTHPDARSCSASLEPAPEPAPGPWPFTGQPRACGRPAP